MPRNRYTRFIRQIECQQLTRQEKELAEIKRTLPRVMHRALNSERVPAAPVADVA